MEPTTLDYHRAARPARLMPPGFCALIIAAFGIIAGTTMWMQSGAYLAPRFGVDMTDPYSGAAAAWRIGCIEAPLIALLIAILSLVAVTILLVALRAWSRRLLLLLPALPFLFVMTLAINYGVIEMALD